MMVQVLVRDMDAEVVERLKQRARRHGRSLRKEAKAILENAASRHTMEEAREAGRRVRRRLKNWRKELGRNPFPRTRALKHTVDLVGG